MDPADRADRLRAIATTIERPYAAAADDLRTIARTLEETTHDRHPAPRHDPADGDPGRP